MQWFVIIYSVLLTIFFPLDPVCCVCSSGIKLIFPIITSFQSNKINRIQLFTANTVITDLSEKCSLFLRRMVRQSLSVGSFRERDACKNSYSSSTDTRFKKN
ncbi:uncharacterized protein BYT42DRAFT_583949 [Radiomyces spectabilis]|uniref:uncharacterized protein n=1 Tax=Radiomyces spectabilis TaxID=64574 RepID=UPI00221F2123|nr:uncharacterized protein BYT42DRAFT_583949 [Radiomyces spectabilis]KAI8369322.1 hypothetical protein BYT42DRAFT_583949 [Radiomyces spectabilis]